MARILALLMIIPVCLIAIMLTILFATADEQPTSAAPLWALTGTIAALSLLLALWPIG